MHLSPIVVLVCLALVAAYALPAPAIDAISPDEHLLIQEAEELPVHERSPRTKRGLLLLKKKLLLGALGLKALKVAKIGAVGVAGAFALKKAKAASYSSGHSGVSVGSYGYSSSYPDWHVSVRSW